MKKNLFLSLVLLLPVFMFVSCSSNDNEDEPKSPIEKVIKCRVVIDGEYKGEKLLPSPEKEWDKMTAVLKLTCRLGESITIDWGDGTVEDVSPNYEKPATHKYTATGTYNISLSSENLTSLDFSETSNIQGDLTIGLCPNLESLMVLGNSSMNSLTLGTNCPNLESLLIMWCDNLETIDVSQCSKLISYSIIFCPKVASNIDLSKNTELAGLSISSTQISSIDLTKNTKLVQLEFYGNKKVTSLDLSKNIKLKSAILSNNALKTLEVAENTTLKLLDCSNNLMDAEGLNALFKSLPKLDRDPLAEAGGAPEDFHKGTLYIGGNPGEYSCDKSLMNNTWRIYSFEQ